MGKKKERKRKREPGAPGEHDASGAGSPAERESWYRAKRPALRFVLIAGGFMLLFYAVFYTSPEESPALDRFIRNYLSVYASTAGFLLERVGFDVRVLGTSISLDGRAVEVARGCDALEPIALFVAAVIAVQVELRRKLPGILVGVPLLVLLNLVRIIALTVVSAKFPEQFETAHLTVGQIVFIVCTLSLWFAWVTWATREREEARATPAD